MENLQHMYIRLSFKIRKDFME